MTHRALKRRPRWLPLPERSALTRPLPWLIFLALLLILSGVGLIARVALNLASPDVLHYGGDLAARGGADYSFWPGGPLIPPINPEAIAAAAADQAPPGASGPPAPQNNVPIAVVGAPTISPAAPSVAPASPSPEPTQTASATATAPPPTATATATATRTAAARQAPTSAPARQPSTAVPVTAPSAPPSATPVSAPGAPGAPTAPATPRPTNTAPPTATRTPQPSPTSPPPPTSTARPTTAPTSPGTPTAIPSATSTPEPPTPALSFASASYTLSEAKGEVTVELRLSEAYFRPVTMSYASGGGSATPNSDYKPVSGSFTFSPGEVTKAFKVTALADELNEPSESFNISLSGVTNASIGEPQLATVLITDSDAPPVVRFAGSTRTVAERVGSLAVTVELSEPSAINVSVPFAVRGTAGLGDHELRAGAAIIPAGASSVRIRFAVVDDRIDEDDETLSIYLGTPANAQLGAPSVYTVMITDDDDADVVVSATSLELSEAPAVQNHRRTYSVRLDSQPTAPVTITLTPDAEATVSPASLVFTAANWSTPQVVTVTAVDDAVDEDGNRNGQRHTGEVAHNLASADPNYNNFAVDPLELLITDNDSAGVTVSATNLELSEAPAAPNRAQIYSIRLDSQPTAPVTITLTPDAQATVNPAELVFTAASWDVAQTVTVIAVDDAIDEADGHPGIVRHTVTSADGIYDGFAVADLALAITDDDTAEVRIAPPAAPVPEGGTITYTVRLGSQPTAPVTITLTPDAEATVSPASLVFTAANWSTPQVVAVTAVDDAVDEASPHTSTIRHAVTSDDTGYRGIAVAPINLSIIDNDTAGVQIGQLALTVAEGETTSYTVQLMSEPTEPVTISLAFDTALLTVTAPAQQLRFDKTTWNISQTVTITATENYVDAVNPLATITQTVTSSDPSYDFPIEPVSVTITDDDTAGVEVSPQQLTVSEGETVTYGVRLTSQPTATATVTLTPTFDTAQLTVMAPLEPLTFTAANWTDPQTVTLQAVDDAIQETNPHTVTVTHTLMSADPIYAALTADPLEIGIADNDEAGLEITPVSLSMSESLTGTHSTAAAVYVRLRSEPTYTVTVSLIPDAQLTADVTTLVFDSGNYSVTQTIMLTAVDDYIDETDSHTGTLTLSAQSEDPNYNQPFAPYEVAIEDDDTTHVSIGHTVSLNEGNGGLRLLHFPITLTLTAAVPVNVRYETFDLSAVGGADGQPVPDVDYHHILSGTLTFAPGELSKTIAVIVRGDNGYELDEQFGVRLTAVGPIGVLDPANVEATGTILNDDLAEPTEMIVGEVVTSPFGMLPVLFEPPAEPRGS